MTSKEIDVIEAEIVYNDDDLTKADLNKLAVIVNRLNARTEDALKNAVVYAWQTGRALLAAKKLCEHGEWMGWLDTNFHGSQRNATRYMALASNWPSAANLNFGSIDAAEKAIREENAAKKNGKGNGHKPKPKPEPVEDVVAESTIEEHLTALWDIAATLPEDVRANMADDLKALAENCEGGTPNPQVRIANAIEALRGAGGTVHWRSVEKVINEMGAPNVAAAGHISMALAGKWGSWASFDKARKAYNAECERARKNNTAADFTK